MDYEAMLVRAKEQLPEDVDESTRFQVPKIKGHLQGNKTIVSNFAQIASTLQRKIEVLVKYIEKQMATKGIIQDNFVVFNTKLSAKKMNIRIEQFVDQFVICKECGKPDTKLSKDTGIYFIRCQACGAKYSVNVKF